MINKQALIAIKLKKYKKYHTKMNLSMRPLCALMRQSTSRSNERSNGSALARHCPHGVCDLYSNYDISSIEKKSKYIVFVNLNLVKN